MLLVEVSFRTSLFQYEREAERLSQHEREFQYKSHPNQPTIKEFSFLPSYFTQPLSILLKLWISSLSWPSYQKKYNTPSGARFPAAEVRDWDYPSPAPLTSPQPPWQLLAWSPKKISKRKNHSATDKAHLLLKLHFQQLLPSMIPSPAKLFCHQKWHFCSSKSFCVSLHIRRFPLTGYNFSMCQINGACNNKYHVTEGNTNMSYCIFSQLHGAS